MLENGLFFLTKLETHSYTLKLLLLMTLTFLGLYDPCSTHCRNLHNLCNLECRISVIKVIQNQHKKQ